MDWQLFGTITIALIIVLIPVVAAQVTIIIMILSQRTQMDESVRKILVHINEVMGHKPNGNGNGAYMLNDVPKDLGSK